VVLELVRAVALSERLEIRLALGPCPQHHAQRDANPGDPLGIGGAVRATVERVPNRGQYERHAVDERAVEVEEDGPGTRGDGTAHAPWLQLVVLSSVQSMPAIGDDAS